MDHAKSRIAVLDGIYNNAHREKVIDLIHRLILVDHLFIDTEKCFTLPLISALNACIFNVLRHFLYNLLHNSPLCLPGVI